MSIAATEVDVRRNKKLLGIRQDVRRGPGDSQKLFPRDKAEHQAMKFGDIAWFYVSGAPKASYEMH